MTDYSLSLKGNLVFLIDQILFNAKKQNYINMKISFHCIWEIPVNSPQTQNNPNDEGNLCFKSYFSPNWETNLLYAS